MRLPSLCSLVMLCSLTPLPAAVSLEKQFAQPPDEAKPLTWWHWMNGNISTNGITKDLEAMKRIGLGGAQVFNVEQGEPPGPVPPMSPAWTNATQHAIREANRLGLKLTFHNGAGWSESGGPWVTPDKSMQHVVWTEIRVTGPTNLVTLPQPKATRDFYRDIAVLAFPAPANDTARIPQVEQKAAQKGAGQPLFPVSQIPADACVAQAAIQDVTKSMAADGTLGWSVPAGNWIVLRMGHTSTGHQNAPAPASARGLECDKLDAAAVTEHFEGYIGDMARTAGKLAGKSLVAVLADSWEAGLQNWTPAFRTEFQKRRGYDLLPWLPTLTGRAVDNAEVSDRFLWDFRLTIAELVEEKYYAVVQKLCKDHGLLFTAEAPGIGMPTTADQLACKSRTDVPMGEFWADGHNDSREPACAAHIYGQKYVAAEAFTANVPQARWTKAPFDSKALGDLHFSLGINRFVFHRYAHQPDDRVPGMTMGPWGLNFERSNTWWEQGKPWMDYLTRSQFLLQSGRFAADILYFYGEGAPVTLTGHEPAIPAGYAYDACGRDALFRRVSVKDGNLTVPGGAAYRVLLLNPADRMTPGTLKRIAELVDAGAVVLGTAPTRSPSLSGYPACDDELKAIVSKLWGESPGANGDRTVGKGRVIWGRPLAEVLTSLKVEPAVTLDRPAGEVVWLQRRIDGADIYFVANQKEHPTEVAADFRVANRVPELWHADTGTIDRAPVYEPRNGRTVVKMRLEPAESVFVVFRRAAGKLDPVVAVTKDEGPLVRERPVPTGVVEIRSARFGADPEKNDRCVDVTAALQSRVANGRLDATVDNGLAGDPAGNVVKKLVVDYVLDGKPGRLELPEGETLRLPAVVGVQWDEDVLHLDATKDGAVRVTSTKPGRFDGKTASGKALRADIASVVAPLPAGQSWRLSFPAGRGAPEKVELDGLTPWNEHTDPGVKHFSGTAVYHTTLHVTESIAAQGGSVWLDLGSVKEIAEVKLNGVALGTLWKPPFRLDISRVVKSGENDLEVRVTNLWPNRLIGDAGLPPEQRVTWSTRQPYKAGDPLLPSGLIGPVRVLRAEQVVLKPLPTSSP